MDGAFGLDMDYAMLIKTYGETPDVGGPERKYSPSVCTGVRGKKIVGNPNVNYVSTSYVEKHNQSMRQHIRRFTRLTAAHSKKLVNHIHMVALYTFGITTPGSIRRYGCPWPWRLAFQTGFEMSPMS